MTDYKKLIDALHLIKDECKKHEGCIDCPFYVVKEKSACGLGYKNPAAWKIKPSDVIRLLESGEA